MFPISCKYQEVLLFKLIMAMSSYVVCLGFELDGEVSLRHNRVAPHPTNTATKWVGVMVML
jgi:hypothetical protein